MVKDVIVKNPSINTKLFIDVKRNTVIVTNQVSSAQKYVDVHLAKMNTSPYYNTHKNGQTRIYK